MNSKIEPSETINTNILFRNKGYFYDVREKKYIGEVSGNRQIKTSIIPARARIFAILPYKVNNLDVKTDKRRYQVGETVNISAIVKASSRQLGNHVAYMEVYGPDKKAISYYAKKVILENGKGSLKIPTAFNDETGVWTLLVRDVASGVSKKVNITLVK